MSDYSLNQDLYRQVFLCNCTTVGWVSDSITTLNYIFFQMTNLFYFELLINGQYATLFGPTYNHTLPYNNKYLAEPGPVLADGETSCLSPCIFIIAQPAGVHYGHCMSPPACPPFSD